MEKRNLAVDRRELAVYFQIWLPTPPSGSRCGYCRRRDTSDLDLIQWDVTVNEIIDEMTGQVELSGPFGYKVIRVFLRKMLQSRRVCEACRERHLDRIERNFA